MKMNDVAVNTFLLPFAKYFSMDEVSEICINRPEEVWIEKRGEFLRDERKDLSLTFLSQLADLVAENNHREISRESPVLSATLPNGFRVQFVMAPACDSAFVCAIRKPSVLTVPLRNYFKNIKEENPSTILRELYENGDYEKFLEVGVLYKKNIIISGGTSTGKTTLLNTLLKVIPLTERLITIETDREVFSDHKNTVHLLSADDTNGISPISMLELLKTTLRLRPDRILVSELRGCEAYAYLRAINSGHPGSITTLHADSVSGCFEQLALMIMQGGSLLSKENILNYAKNIIDIVVQIKRSSKGERYISEVYFKEARTNFHKKIVNL